MSRHAYECHVRFSDVDVYGHVNNVKYFEYFQEARIAFILSLAGGLFDADSSNRQVVARIDVDYKRPILFRAEPYAVETWVTGSARRRTAWAAGSWTRRDWSTPRPRSTLVTFDVSTQRSRPLTDAERTRLEGARGRVEEVSRPARRTCSP